MVRQWTGMFPRLKTPAPIGTNRLRLESRSDQMDTHHFYCVPANSTALLMMRTNCILFISYGCGTIPNGYHLFGLGEDMLGHNDGGRKNCVERPRIYFEQ